MKAKRRIDGPEFKARVAIEARKGVTTIQQIARDFEAHWVQVSDWKKTTVEGAAVLFGPGQRNAQSEGFDREQFQILARIGAQNRRDRIPDQKVPTTQSMKARVALIKREALKLSMRTQVQIPWGCGFVADLQRA